MSLSPLGCDFVTSLNIFGNTFKMEKRLRFFTIDITLKGMFGLGRADQNMGGALLESKHGRRTFGIFYEDCYARDILRFVCNICLE